MLSNMYKTIYSGVGPAKAISLIRQHKSIEEILKQSKVCHFAIKVLATTMARFDPILFPLETEYSRKLALWGKLLSNW